MGVAMATAHTVPTSSTLDLPHSSTSVRTARKQLATELSERGVAHTTVDDAILVLSELLSNALKHARPLANGTIRVHWRLQPTGRLDIEVTDGGGPTRPNPAAPSITTPSTSAHGGRGLSIIATLASEWGIRESQGEQTVWAALMAPYPRNHRNRRGRAGLVGITD